MARGKSVIDVLIIGDAKRLIGAVNQADQSMGGLLKSAGKLFLASRVVGEGFDFLQGSLQEADRLGDALQRLETQLGPDFAAKLDSTASGFADLGSSRQDILEMEAAFADLSTSIGLTDDAITSFAPAAAGIASAISLVKEVDAATVMDQIGKAAGGSARAAKELGVTLLEGVDPATQMKNILDQLAPTLDAVTTGGADVEQQQRKLGAQWETLQAGVGQLVEGPLTDLLTFINDEIAAIPGAIEGWKMLGGAVEGFGRDALAPIARVADAVNGLFGLIRDLAGAIGSINLGPLSGGSDLGTAAALRRERARNGQGSP